MIELRSLVAVSSRAARMRNRRGRRLRPVRPSRANELWYKAQLLAIVGQLRKAAREELLPELKLIEPLFAPATDGLTRDAVIPRRALDTTFQRMAQRFGGIDQVAQRLAAGAVQRTADAVDDRLKGSVKSSVGIDIAPLLTRNGTLLNKLGEATRANIDLITSIPEQHFAKLREAVEKNLRVGVRFEAVAAEIERIADVTESRAKVIARDQTSKMNGAFNQARQTGLGINKYEWQTSGDERVRDTHADNDGKTFSWDSPPPITGHPGDDVLCRCVALPIFDLDAEEDALGL